MKLVILIHNLGRLCQLLFSGGHATLSIFQREVSGAKDCSEFLNSTSSAVHTGKSHTPGL